MSPLGRRCGAAAGGAGGRLPERCGSFAGFLEVVRRVPAGRVVTYGQVARMAGLPGAARQVGWALHALPEGTEVPWHRVVNARGEISARGTGPEALLQRMRLEGEGVRFGPGERLDLGRFGWDGRPVGRRRTPPAGVRTRRRGGNQ